MPETRADRAEQQLFYRKRKEHGATGRVHDAVSQRQPATPVRVAQNNEPSSEGCQVLIGRQYAPDTGVVMAVMPITLHCKNPHAA